MLIELPHRRILILASVCISIILVSLSYQIITNKKTAAGLYSDSITVVAGNTEESSLSDKRVLEALEQAKKDELGALASSTNPFAPSPKDSISDRFSKDVFAAFLKYRAADGDISDDDLSREAIANINTKGMPKPKYNISDLVIFSPKNKDEIQKYGNDFAQNYLEVITPVAKNPAKYDKQLSNLTPVYRSIGEKLIKIPVPSEVAAAHLQLSNSFIIMADTFGIIDNQQKDPVKALLGLRIIQETVPQQADLFTQISDYFDRNAILFDKREYGAIWNQSYPTGISASTTTNSLKNLTN